MGGNFRVTLLNSIPDDADLREQWNALVLRVDQPQVFYTWEWAFAVQSAYGSDLKPLLFLAFDEQRALRGVAALAIPASGHQASFLCATTGDYCDFLSLPEDKPAFVAGILAQMRERGIEDVVLTNLPEDSDSVSALREAAATTGYHCFMRTAYECAQVLFSRLERGPDGKPVAPGRRRIRRFAKAVAGGGAVEFDHIRSCGAVAPLLPQFIQAHVVRFLELGRISNLASKRRQTFVSEFLRVASPRQWVVLSRMRVGARVFAWHYGFEFHDNWFWYQPTFDSSVEKHWPGFCLLSHVIQHATENPALNKLDLGLGAEAYKSKFANATRRTLYVTLHRSPWKRRVEIVRYRASQALQKRPGFERVVRSWVARYNAFRERMRDTGTLSSALWASKRALRTIAARDEILFYEIPEPESEASSGVMLQTIDMNLLASAAMQYSDADTLSYLIRSARRLKNEETCSGFALTDAEGNILNLTWVRPFEGFYFSELGATAPSSPENSMILFDSWTPRPHRGHGFYGQAVTLVAKRVRQEEKRSWIFSAATNASSIRGLQKADWRPSYSLCRYRILGWSKITEHSMKDARSPVVEGHPR